MDKEIKFCENCKFNTTDKTLKNCPDCNSYLWTVYDFECIDKGKVVCHNIGLTDEDENHISHNSFYKIVKIVIRAKELLDTN